MSINQSINQSIINGEKKESSERKRNMKLAYQRIAGGARNCRHSWQRNLGESGARESASAAANWRPGAGARSVMRWLALWRINSCRRMAAGNKRRAKL